MGPVEVSDYIKGTKYPYRVMTLSGNEVPVKENKFSVKGLRRYNPNEPKKATDEQKVVGTATHSDTVQRKADCQCDMSEYFTKTEVLQLLSEQWSDTGLMAGTVEEELQSRVDSLEGKVLILAEVTDRNFSTVARKFKKLNHDDD